MHPAGTQGPKTAGRVLRSARLYDFFDRIAAFARRPREHLVELAAPAPGERALDVGCGTGTLALALKAHVGSGAVSGIDASPQMIAVARDKARKAGAEIELRVALIEALPFPDGAFDLVTSSLMLHHLPSDVKRAGLAEVRRVLAPGGRFLAMDLAAHGHSPLGQLFSLLGGHGADAALELVPLLKDVGFSQVEVVPTRHARFAFVRARRASPSPGSST